MSVVARTRPWGALPRACAEGAAGALDQLRERSAARVWAVRGVGEKGWVVVMHALAMPTLPGADIRDD